MRKPRLHQRHNPLLILAIIAIPRQFHQQIKPPRPMFIRRVGQPLHLGRRQPLQLQLARRRIHCKPVALVRRQSRLVLQRPILLIRIAVMPSLVVSIAQAAQLHHRQA
jgi:hypothetical protein